MSFKWYIVAFAVALVLGAGCNNGNISLVWVHTENSGNTTPVLFDGESGFLPDEDAGEARDSRGVKRSGFNIDIEVDQGKKGSNVLTDPLAESSEKESGDSSDPSEEPSACLEPGTDLRELNPPTSRPAE